MRGMFAYKREKRRSDSQDALDHVTLRYPLGFDLHDRINAPCYHLDRLIGQNALQMVQQLLGLWRSALTLRQLEEHVSRSMSRSTFTARL